MLCRNIHLDSSSHCLWSLLITWKWYLLCMYNFLNFYQRVRLFFSVFIQVYDVINKQEYSLWYWSWFAQQSCTTSSLFISKIYSIYFYLYWKFKMVTSIMSQVRGYTESSQWICMKLRRVFVWCEIKNEFCLQQVTPD